MRDEKVVLAIVLLLCLIPVRLLAACEPGPCRNVILITLDTTRADRMGFLGSEWKLTPNLDVLAHDAIDFMHAYAQSPLTTTSHATILTGTYPQFHHVAQAGVPLPNQIPYAPEIFRSAGYRTAACVGSMIMQAQGGGAPGFDRGFDHYDADFHSLVPGGNRYTTIERRAKQVLESAWQWIDKNDHAPFFVWIHLYDPHAPYEPPEPYANRFHREPYDGEIAYVDSALGTFFEQLRTKKLYADSVIAVMGDHGEALGEHGEHGHGLFLYDTTIHVPLVLKFPVRDSAGKKVAARVELVDVLPTLLATIGIPVPTSVQGRSLLPLLQAREENRSAYAETNYPFEAFGWSPLSSLRVNEYLFVYAPRPELYDTTLDPSEQHNLAPTSHAMRDTLAAELEEFRKKTGNSKTAATDLNAQQTDQLRALGYMSSSGTYRKTEAALPDPKDKVEISNELTDIAFVLDQGHYDEAIRRLQVLLAKDSTLVPAYDALAMAWAREGNLQSSLAALRKVVELAPGGGLGHLQLAMTLIQLRDLQGAEPELLRAAELMPQSAQIHYEVARLYFNTGRLSQAKQAALQARALQPRHYEANLMLGAICLAQNEATAAIPYLQIAAQTEPAEAKPHEYLARVYGKLGNDTLAQQEKALAQKLESGAER